MCNGDKREESENDIELHSDVVSARVGKANMRKVLRVKEAMKWVRCKEKERDIYTTR